ncbi:hypothetical protein AB0A05_07595 [Streptomyces sp. NPDC046374]
MTPTPSPAPPDAEERLAALLAPVCPQDRDESPFGWSTPDADEQEPR